MPTAQAFALSLPHIKGSLNIPFSGCLWFTLLCQKTIIENELQQALNRNNGLLFQLTAQPFQAAEREVHHV
ncbi:hypothetical protein [Kingella oralis]|uniref:hypothetical protein n=1 Tax=Kingella oralis TaxID=505 RepID=UPI0034E5250F